MYRRKFERIGMTRLFVVGCAAFFGACVCAYAIDPQFVQPVPATPPVFNPSYPYTVAQPPNTPISARTPSVFSGSDVSIPLTRSHRRLTRAHRRAATKVAKVRTQEIPTLPVEQLCRATSTQNVNPLAAEGDAKAAFAQCIQAERSLREQVTKEWANFSQADKQHCVSLVQMGGSASYAELITCLEMAREVRDLRSTSSAPPQSSTLSQSSAANPSVPQASMPTAGAAAVQPTPVNRSQSMAEVQEELERARIDAETAKRSEALTRRKIADAEATMQRLKGEAERATAEAERAKADTQSARAALALARRKLADESTQLPARDRTAERENLDESARLILVASSSIIILLVLIVFYLLHKSRTGKDRNAVAELSEVKSPAMVPEKSYAENVSQTAADSVPDS